MTTRSLRAFVGLAIVAISAPAAGAEDARPLPENREIVASCRQGQCAWVRILRNEVVSAASLGTLRRITTARGWSAMDVADRPAADAIRWEPGEQADYAFCSAARPAYAFDGTTGQPFVIHFLDLFDLAGYQMASARLYLAACHDLDAPAEEPAMLRRLGYGPGTRSEQIEAASLEAMTVP